MKIKDKNTIKKILFITLSNIGDIILTTPVLSVLKREFPTAAIDVLSGPNGSQIFTGHPLVANFIMYDKFSNMAFKRQLIKNLKKNRYDLIVDLRNSLFPLLIGSRYRTSVMRSMPRSIVHKKDQHLWRLKGLGLDIEAAPFAFHVGEEDESYIENILAELGVRRVFAVISPGAKSHIKRWTKEGFALLCDRLFNELGLDVVMVGDSQDAKIISEIKGLMKNRAFDLSKRLNLRQLGALIKRSRFLVTNDSAPMHIGHALGVKALVAIFGPTDPKKYGPKEKGSIIIRKELACSPCEAAQCKENHECMKLISAEEIFETVKRLLNADLRESNAD